jgi:putative ABC transport system substrate-binding protein
MIRRREFITLLGGAVTTWPLAVRAQQGNRVRRIGVLMPNDETDPVGKTYVSAFKQALADLGWTDGRVGMDLRWGGNDTIRIRALAQELVGLRPDIIVTNGTPATVALQRETRTIPIVLAGVGDPVPSGLVEGLNQPGGNITGFANYEASLGGKWLELLSEIAPGLKRAAIMFNPDTAPVSSYMPSFEAAARSLKVAPMIAPVHSDAEIETTIIALGGEPGGGLVVMPGAFMGLHRAWIISAAARNNVPAVHPNSPPGQRRRLALLRKRYDRHLSSRRRLRRSHPARREAGGATRSVSDQVRDGREPQDRHGARPCHTPIDSAAR